MSGLIEPIQARLGTQPRQLAFGELPGRRDAAFDCLIQAIFAIQITPELPVSDRANRRQFRMQITARMQGTYLVEKTRRHHRVKTLRDPRVQFTTRRRIQRQLAPVLGGPPARRPGVKRGRSEEHTSELQSLMRISYAVF